MSANWNEGSIATPDDLVDQLVRDPSGSGRSESLTVRRLQRAWPRVGGTFYFEMLVPAPLPKTCPKMVLSHKGGSLCVKTFLQKKFWRRERLPLSALAPARRAAAVSEPKPPPCPLTVRAHHGARPCWRKSTC